MKTKGDILKEKIIAAIEELLTDAETDLKTGLDEGIYDDDTPKAYHNELRNLIAEFKEFTPKIYALIEGGNFQGASANCRAAIEVYDKDHAKSELEYRINNGTPEDWEKSIKEKLNNNTIKPID